MKMSSLLSSNFATTTGPWFSAGCRGRGLCLWRIGIAKSSRCQWKGCGDTTPRHPLGSPFQMELEIFASEIWAFFSDVSGFMHVHASSLSEKKFQGRFLVQVWLSRWGTSQYWFRPVWCHQSFTLVKLASLILAAIGNTFQGYPAIPQLSKQGRLHPKGWQYFQEVLVCLIAWCSAMIEAGAYTKKVLLPFLLCWFYVDATCIYRYTCIFYIYL